MGRSYLSIKLAVVFGLLVAVLITAYERLTEEPAPNGAVQESLVGQEADVAPAADVAGVEVICVWRACPGAGHLLPRSGRAAGA